MKQYKNVKVKDYKEQLRVSPGMNGYYILKRAVDIVSSEVLT